MNCLINSGISDSLTSVIRGTIDVGLSSMLPEPTPSLSSTVHNTEMFGSRSQLMGISTAIHLMATGGRTACIYECCQKM